jgi:PelA/Pel-15E family pectate lyase
MTIEDRERAGEILRLRDAGRSLASTSVHSQWRGAKFLSPFITMLAAVATACGAAENLRADAEAALRRGVDFFRTQVAVEGTYLWQYSADLSQREGEGAATATQGWVQPPGTPAVGLALLAAWRATSNTTCLDAVRATAHGLARGQLRSGGWTYSIDFSAEGRRKAAYRDAGGTKGRNFTTLDDDTTQCALRFLAQADEALGFRDAKIRECVEFALAALLAAQYPNGAWPQGFDRAPEPEKFPVRKAVVPESWPRVWPGSQNYWLRYTLNDNALATTVETLFELASLYEAKEAGADFNRLAARGRVAAAKAGDFLLLAQLPEPQPAWAQQYDFDMHPAWARKFEPPAVTGGESQQVLRTLMLLARETGGRKYLAPVPSALAYLRRSRLPDGKLARFYELGSNRPLYFTKGYTLTHDDGDMPTHYAFKVPDRTDAIARDFERLRDLPDAELRTRKTVAAPKATPELTAAVKSIIAAQDARGRWVEDGQLRGAGERGGKVIRCETFNRNVETLSRYLVATRP